MTTFSLAISHTPWVPERVASMARLQAQLEGEPFHARAVFCDKEPNHVWSERMWSWAAKQDVEWCVFLQDDCVVAPEFLMHLEIITRWRGHYSGVLGLQVAHPAAVPLFEEGFQVFTTTDGLVGVGYAVPRDLLREFLQWRTDCLRDGALEAITEDSLLGLWCAVTERPIFHPIPTIVDHDTDVPSQYGNDAHTNRRSRVRWDTAPSDEETRGGCPHLGRFYESTPHLAKKWVKGFSEQEFVALLGDNGAREKRRIHYARKARNIEAKARLFIATPHRGSVHSNWAASTWRILRDEWLDVEGNIEMFDIQQRSADVVRVRSRFANHFLKRTDATHLLFLDADVEVSPECIRGMLATGKDFVATPYPRRDHINFSRVRHETDMSPESAAYRYSIQFIEGKMFLESDATAEIEGIGLGCALISRVGLERMTAHYADSLTFEDDEHGPTVALFQLDLSDRRLLSEDYSFCKRWRAMGEKVWMYVGVGSPANHYGEHAYKGNIEAFGLTRVPAGK